MLISACKETLCDESTRTLRASTAMERPETRRMETALKSRLRRQRPCLVLVPRQQRAAANAPPHPRAPAPDDGHATGPSASKKMQLETTASALASVVCRIPGVHHHMHEQVPRQPAAVWQLARPRATCAS